MYGAYTVAHILQYDIRPKGTRPHDELARPAAWVADGVCML